MTASVGLVRALGGGWRGGEAEAPSSAASKTPAAPLAPAALAVSN